MITSAGTRNTIQCLSRGRAPIAAAAPRHHAAPLGLGQVAVGDPRRRFHGVGVREGHSLPPAGRDARGDRGVSSATDGIEGGGVRQNGAAATTGASPLRIAGARPSTAKAEQAPVGRPGCSGGNPGKGRPALVGLALTDAVTVGGANTAVSAVTPVLLDRWKPVR